MVESKLFSKEKIAKLQICTNLQTTFFKRINNLFNRYSQSQYIKNRI